MKGALRAEKGQRGERWLQKCSITNRPERCHCFPDLERNQEIFIEEEAFRGKKSCLHGGKGVLPGGQGHGFQEITKKNKNYSQRSIRVSAKVT